MKRILLSILLFASVVACQKGQDKQQEPKKQDPAAVLKEVMASFEKEGLKLDAKKRAVTIPVVVNTPQDPIEYLLIHKRGKKHESVFWTETKPSILNAALLMIGLEKGQNATYVEKDPPPTLEQIQKGADPLIITSPKGQPYYMTVRWTTPEKQVEEFCIEDLILDLTTQEPIGSCEWVYLGGRMAQLYKDDPEVYIADFEGNLISICYLTPDNHLGTMAHERARDDQNWWTTNKLPEPGTAMEFTFHAVAPPLYVKRQERLRAAKQRKDAAGGKKDAKPAKKKQ